MNLSPAALKSTVAVMRSSIPNKTSIMIRVDICQGNSPSAVIAKKRKGQDEDKTRHKTQDTRHQTQDTRHKTKTRKKNRNKTRQGQK
jgi:hypothetical protein